VGEGKWRDPRLDPANIATDHYGPMVLCIPFASGDPTIFISLSETLAPYFFPALRCSPILIQSDPEREAPRHRQDTGEGFELVGEGFGATIFILINPRKSNCEI